MFRSQPEVAVYFDYGIADPRLLRATGDCLSNFLGQCCRAHRSNEAPSASETSNISVGSATATALLTAIR